jgi:hypothetical protein
MSGVSYEHGVELFGAAEHLAAERALNYLTEKLIAPDIFGIPVAEVNATRENLCGVFLRGREAAQLGGETTILKESYAEPLLVGLHGVRTAVEQTKKEWQQQRPPIWHLFQRIKASRDKPDFRQLSTIDGLIKRLSA